MKNHFLFSYAGNKRQEVERIYDVIKDDVPDKTTIIEPFCGSCAFSYYLSTLFPNKFKYIINDINPILIELFRIVRDKDAFEKFVEEMDTITMSITTKEEYMKILKGGGVKGYVLSNLIYAIRPGMYNFNYKPKKFDLANKPIVKFLQNEDIELLSIDAIDIVKEYQNNPDVLLFIDPPYINSCNDFYTSKQNQNIYEYLHNEKINTMNSKIVLALENHWIIMLAFKDFVKATYDKEYQMTHKKTKHITITN